MSSNKRLLCFVSVILVTGIVAGSVTVLFMPDSERIAIKNKLGLLFEFRSPSEGNLGTDDYWKGMKKYFLLGFILFLLSLSVIGIPLLLFYICAKGFILGFTSSFLIYAIGNKGILFILLAIIPQNILLIPTLIIYAVIGISFAKTLLLQRIIRIRGQIKPQVVTFFMSSLILFSILILTSLYESLLAPYIYDRAMTFIA